jgi:hypothetical protein
MDDPSFTAGLRPIPSGISGEPPPWPAVDLVGTTPSGEPTTVTVRATAGRLLLAFLSVDCVGCQQFWDGFRSDGGPGLPADVDAAIVTRGTASLEVGEVRSIAHGITGTPVVMSDLAWADYRVTGYPFFVLIDRASGRVSGETVGLDWEEVRSMASSTP